MIDVYAGKHGSISTEKYREGYKMLLSGIDEEILREFPTFWAMINSNVKHTNADADDVMKWLITVYCCNEIIKVFLPKCAFNVKNTCTGRKSEKNK